jgi:hypothetical protein
MAGRRIKLCIVVYGAAYLIKLSTVAGSGLAYLILIRWWTNPNGKGRQKLRSSEVDRLEGRKAKTCSPIPVQ